MNENVMSSVSTSTSVSVATGELNTVDEPVAAFCEAVARIGLPTLIPNASVDFSFLTHDSRLLPLTISRGETGGSYVVQPHSAYIGYAIDELSYLNLGWGRLGLACLVRAVGWPLLAAGIGRSVLIDNYGFATNLHGDWHGQGLAKMREQLYQQYPRHFFGIRSVDPWSSPELCRALKADGWLFLPARQVWTIDDPEKEWRPRSHVKRDQKLVRDSRVEIEDLEKLTDSDAQRITDLYQSLYRQKYSCLNPDYTARWIQLLVDTRLVTFRVARDRDGQIQAMAGHLERDGLLTVPLIGYDRSQPQASGLYRIASWLSGDHAARKNLRFHASAGAGAFKRHRGARGQIEFLACYVNHLPRTQQVLWRGFSCFLYRHLVPLLVNNGW